MPFLLLQFTMFFLQRALFVVAVCHVCCYSVLCLLLQCAMFVVTVFHVCCNSVPCLLLQCAELLPEDGWAPGEPEP